MNMWLVASAGGLDGGVGVEPRSGDATDHLGEAGQAIRSGRACWGVSGKKSRDYRIAGRAGLRDWETLGADSMWPSGQRVREDDGRQDHTPDGRWDVFADTSCNPASPEVSTLYQSS